MALRPYVNMSSLKLAISGATLTDYQLTDAQTWPFYYKSGKWCVAVSFTPSNVERVSHSVDYGGIGIYRGPGSIGWAYIDPEGNLKAPGQISLQTGLPKGQQQAIIVRACLELAALATKYLAK
jgi:hypothetical protein